MKLTKVEIMSSREIAELTGKNHADIMRDIRNLSNQVKLELGESSFALSSYLSNQNKKLPQYLLTKKECLLLMSGYNPVLRLKIINRWEELETRLANPLRNSIEFYKRYEINKQNIPTGYFSMIEETINRVIIPLELDGKDLLKESLPDGSLGRGFCAFLRGKDIDTSKLPTYKHTINNIVVDAKLYKDEYFVFFKQYINDWTKGNGKKYFTTRTKLLLNK